MATSCVRVHMNVRASLRFWLHQTTSQLWGFWGSDCQSREDQIQAQVCSWSRGEPCVRLGRLLDGEGADFGPLPSSLTDRSPPPITWAWITPGGKQGLHARRECADNREGTHVAEWTRFTVEMSTRTLMWGQD